LNIRLVKKNSQGTALNQVDGGIYERLCRWTSDRVPIPCYLYDTGKPQGAVIAQTPDGGPLSHKNPRTPYPSAFISLTDPVTGTKYAVWPSVWPTSTIQMSWPTEIVTSDFAIYRAVKSGEFVRCSPGYNPIENDNDDKGTCRGETYAPFGSKKVVLPKGKNRSVEGWFDDLVPYREGGTEADSHKLEVQNCGVIPASQISHTLCWWKAI